jgi:hypothetical protein
MHPCCTTGRGRAGSAACFRSSRHTLAARRSKHCVRPRLVLLLLPWCAAAANWVVQEGIDLAKVPMTVWFHRQLRRCHGTRTMGSSSLVGDSRLLVAQSSNQAPSTKDSGVGSRPQGIGRRVFLPPSSRNAGPSAQSSAVCINSSSSSSSSSGGPPGDGSSGQEQHGASMLTGSFRDWVCQEEQEGKITFSMKGAGDLCSSAAVAV